jgi:TPM domain
MRIIAAILSALLCIAVQAEEARLDSKYGERPENSVYDPSGVLSPEQQETISRPLREILKNEGVDVLVVVLPEIGDAPPEHVVKGFAEIWAKAKVNSVVLHVPGRDGSPWIFPGELMSRMINPEVVREAIADAEKRSAAESTDFGKVRAASTEASDILRYWKGGALIRSELIVNHGMKMRLEYANRRRLIKLIAVIGAALLIPLLAGAAFIFIRVRNSRPRAFPEIKVVTRLGAPYSGGNSIYTRFV